MFQSTPPRGGRLIQFFFNPPKSWLFQSTPPRGGRPQGVVTN